MCVCPLSYSFSVILLGFIMRSETSMSCMCVTEQVCLCSICILQENEAALIGIACLQVAGLLGLQYQIPANPMK